MINKFTRGVHISDCKFKEFLKLLSLDLTTTQISNILSINRNAVVVSGIGTLGGFMHGVSYFWIP